MTNDATQRRLVSYHPVAIANNFIQLARKSRQSLDGLKLVKLVYIAHGWSLYFYQTPLVDEAAEAWPDGPVMPSVVHAFKDYRGKKIKKPVAVFDWEAKVYQTPRVLNSLSALGLWLDCRWACPMAIISVIATTATIAVSYWPGLQYFMAYGHVSPATQTAWLLLSNGSCLCLLMGLAWWRRVS